MGLIKVVGRGGEEEEVEEEDFAPPPPPSSNTVSHFFVETGISRKKEHCIQLCKYTQV